MGVREAKKEVLREARKLYRTHPELLPSVGLLIEAYRIGRIKRACFFRNKKRRDND